jgi:hypothetical protein
MVAQTQKLIKMENLKQEITFESHPRAFIKSLKNELAIAKEELQNAGRSKPQFLIDDDDEYQDQLELSWWKDEQRETIKTLEESITHYQSIRPTINPVNSQGLRYVNEEIGYVDQDEEYY